MATIGWYLLAALSEIAGCFAFWAWLKLGRSPGWIAPGLACLILFAVALTRVDAAHAGRAFAAYGGIYVACSVAWLWLVERQVPDRWDLLGSAVVLGGAAIVLWGPRAAA
ncbi:YnfA family protein [Caulobacter sp. 17J65-9]|uniref:YnfA family protein n=1 Tax=Caulobacter sp. 17J65-9 TaxID=2709382 RepID=UPI0013C66CBD|nr:YnfA family protein [Caulobacter sp. 17J65-9]NEX91826.1 YnfA family protein [Caulobacter sp. 17J65-9]